MKSASLQYANALADVAFEKGAVAEIRNQLQDFGSLYKSSSELRNFLASPAVPSQPKHGVIEKLLGRLGGNKILRNFLFVVIDHQRTHSLPEIIASFEEVIRQREGVVEAQVTSAIELSAQQKAELDSTLSRVTGMRVETKFALEPALLGGAVVRVGDTVYDGSVRTRLNELLVRLEAE